MTDMKLLTLMLNELNEMMKFLQVRCYYKFRMTLHKSICKIKLLWQFSVLLFIASWEARKKAALHNVSFQSCVQILMTSFID